MKLESWRREFWDSNWKRLVRPQVSVRSYFDGFGRGVRVEQGDDTAGVTSVAETEYAPCACSPLGKQKRAATPHAPGATPVWTVYDYDALGRTTTITAPDNSTTRYEYLGRTVKVIDPAGKWKRMTLDSFGNIVQVNEPNPGGGELVTNYEYDGFNQLLKVTMPRSTGTQTRTWTYDYTIMRLTSMTLPESGTTTFTWDANSRLASKTDAGGRTLNYGYDSHGRPIWVKNGTTQVVTYTYDSNPYESAYSANAAGRLAAVQYRTSWQPNNLYGSGSQADQSAGNALDPKYPQGTLTEEFSYTAAGQVAKKRLRVRRGPAIKDLEATLTYSGDAVRTIAYPNGGPTYTYEYDVYKRLVGLLEGTTQLENGVTYGAAGEVLQRVAPGQPYSIVTTYSYNSLLQLTRIRKSANGSNSDVEYRYTATINNGQVMQEYSQATGETVNYQYDELNRLISARNVNTSKWGMEWEYDGFGNRTVQRVVQGSAVPITLTYDAATNRITSPGYVYNARGELTAMPKGAGSQTLAWDWNSRLKQAGSDTAGERYDYSADNRLVYTKEMTTGTERFTFRLGAQVLGTYRPTVNTYGTITGFTTSSTKRAPFLDGLKQHPGSTGSYFPYGEKKEPPVGSADGFGTYSRRDATGLDYADQRWYSSQTGRFLTPDPYIASGGPGEPGSWNRYGYVEGDPVNRVDPTGLFYYIGGAQQFSQCVWVTDLWGWSPLSASFSGCLTSGSGAAYGQFAFATYAGAGGGPSIVSASRGSINAHNIRKTGAQFEIVDSRLDTVAERLKQDPDCFSWLTSGLRGARVADDRLFAEVRSRVGVASYIERSGNKEDGIAAVANIGDWDVVVNGSGAFFYGGVLPGVPGQMDAKSIEGQVLILLHELGHVVGASMSHDDFDAGRNAANNGVVFERCEKTIRGI